jgi:hypothetical protein
MPALDLRTLYGEGRGDRDKADKVPRQGPWGYLVNILLVRVIFSIVSLEWNGHGHGANVFEVVAKAIVADGTSLRSHTHILRSSLRNSRSCYTVAIMF